MKYEELLKDYEMFRVLTQGMLESVKNEQWDRIVSVSDRRERLLEKWRDLDETLISDGADRMRWSDLIHQCLAMNREMEARIEEKMGELQRRLHDEKRLLQAYHSHSGD